MKRAFFRLLLLSLLLSACAVTYGERHIVGRGETIESIASTQGVSAKEVREMNYLGPKDQVSEGDTIFLPAPGEGRKGVKPGETKAVKVSPLPEKTFAEKPQKPAVKKPAEPPPAAAAAPPAPPAPVPVPAKHKPPAEEEKPAPKTSSILLWPVSGKVIRPYGEEGGKGIDISAAGGERVKASAKGSVNYAGLPARAYGAMVILDHGGELYTVYSNMSALAVKTGDKVSAGDVLGSSGDYLHFEVRKGTGAVNPLLYLPRR